MALTEKYVSSTAAGGGSGLTAGSPLTWAEMVTAISIGAAGVRFNVLAGTYSRTTTTDTLTTGGSNTSPVVLRGYASTIGDGFLGRTNGNGALITTNLPLISYTTGRFVTSTLTLLESLSFTSAVASTSVVGLSTDCTMRGCKVVNSGTTATVGVTPIGRDLFAGLRHLADRQRRVYCHQLRHGSQCTHHRQPDQRRYGGGNFRSGIPQFASIGALQRHASASGGGLLRHPGMTGGILG